MSTMPIDLADLLRKFKWKRELDNKGISFRKTLIFVLVGTGLFLYFGPSFLRWLFTSKGNSYDTLSRCINDKIDSYVLESLDSDSHIIYPPVEPDSLSDKSNVLIHFVGNGVVGAETKPDSPLYIKSEKVLSLAVPFQPITGVFLPGADRSDHQREASVLQFVNGLAHKIQCIPYGSACLTVTHQIYAHRTIPSLLVQDIKITNPTDEDVVLSLERGGLSKWHTSVVYTHKFKIGSEEHDCLVITGSLTDGAKQFVVAITTTKLPSTIEVKKRSSQTFHVYTITTYSTMLNIGKYTAIKENLEMDALQMMNSVVTMTSRQLRAAHVEVWHHLFSSGLFISTSKAAGAINGDRINATLYMTLSQVRAQKIESEMSQEELNQHHSHLAYTEGCYGGHHTLQATRLWLDLNSMDRIVQVTSLWLKTLESQGCHKLVKMGAEGVMQAMLLSFGAWKFSNQHLEFNTEPKDLHRDFLYRRINYGNGTHVNVTVAVLEDNKAVLYVALDRNDKDYYGCDGGCLDSPVQLSSQRRQFPVKLTEPRTAVLYITSDKQHMENLKHTIHVHEVGEAPAHEQHVIALHKHGHALAGLPTFFWATFSLLIVLFHLFLFKLIYNEYCGGIQPETKATRSRKFSDL